jgi:hypothetical protein
VKFDEFIAEIYEYSYTENLEDWEKAKALLKIASQQFTDPDECEKIGNISSELMSSLGYLFAKDSPSSSDEKDVYINEDDDDDEEVGDVVIRVGPSTNGEVEYISG